MNGGPEAHESTGIIFVETQVWSRGLQGVWRWGGGGREGYLGEAEISKRAQGLAPT